MIHMIIVSLLHLGNYVKILLSNLCRATSRGYIKFGCSREVLFLGGNFQWSMYRTGEIFMPVDRGSRSLEVPL